MCPSYSTTDVWIGARARSDAAEKGPDGMERGKYRPPLKGTISEPEHSAKSGNAIRNSDQTNCSLVPSSVSTIVTMTMG